MATHRCVSCILRTLSAPGCRYAGQQLHPFSGPSLTLILWQTLNDTTSTMRRPLNYWKAPAARKGFLLECGRANGFASMEDWYKLSVQQILKMDGGSGICKVYKFSVLKALKDIFPQHQWEEWRFENKPQQWYLDPVSSERFLESIRQEENLEKMEDLYRLSGKALKGYGGAALPPGPSTSSAHRVGSF